MGTAFKYIGEGPVSSYFPISRAQKTGKWPNLPPERLGKEGVSETYGPLGMAFPGVIVK